MHYIHVHVYVSEVVGSGTEPLTSGQIGTELCLYRVFDLFLKSITMLMHVDKMKEFRNSMEFLITA